VDSLLLGDKDLLSGQDGPGELSHACHGGGGCVNTQDIKGP